MPEKLMGVFVLLLKTNASVQQSLFNFKLFNI